LSLKRNQRPLRSRTSLGKLRFRVLGPANLLAACTIGGRDGFRLDAIGNIWTSAGERVHAYALRRADREIKVPAVVAGVCFGGPKRNRL
jgi:gluconolactonase